MTTPESRTGPGEDGGPSLLIRGGRVYRHDGDVDDPPVRDVLIQDSRIVSVTLPDEDAELKHETARRATDSSKAQVIDAQGKLVLPGFVNAVLLS